MYFRCFRRVLANVFCLWREKKTPAHVMGFLRRAVISQRLSGIPTAAVSIAVQNGNDVQFKNELYKTAGEILGTIRFLKKKKTKTTRSF